jgi:hypothetical protein
MLIRFCAELMGTTTLAAVLPIVLDVTVETPDYTHLTLKVRPRLIVPASSSSLPQTYSSEYLYLYMRLCSCLYMLVCFAAGEHAHGNPSSVSCCLIAVFCN